MYSAAPRVRSGCVTDTCHRWSISDSTPPTISFPSTYWVEAPPTGSGAGNLQRKWTRLNQMDRRKRGESERNQRGQLMFSAQMNGRNTKEMRGGCLAISGNISQKRPSCATWGFFQGEDQGSCRKQNILQDIAKWPDRTEISSHPVLTTLRCIAQLLLNICTYGHSAPVSAKLCPYLHSG